MLPQLWVFAVSLRLSQKATPPKRCIFVADLTTILQWYMQKLNELHTTFFVAKKKLICIIFLLKIPAIQVRFWDFYRSDRSLRLLAENIPNGKYS